MLLHDGILPFAVISYVSRNKLSVHLDEYSKYPLAKFYHVAKFLDESKYDEKGTLKDTKFNFIAQANFDKSNDVSLTYRVNPQGAYVEGAVLNFINRSIQQTRAINGGRWLLS